MKKILGLLFLTLSLKAHATGGFQCFSNIDIAGLNTEVSIHATTSRIEGTPIVGDLFLTIDNNMTAINNEYVVNYWSDETHFKILTLDENYNHKVLKVEYNHFKNNGTFQVAVDGTLYTSNNVECFFE